MQKKTNPHLGSDFEAILDPQSRPVDPLFGWTGEKLKEYIEDKPLQIGDRMLIYGSYGMMHWYNLVTVAVVDHGRQRRVVVDQAAMWGGKSFYRSGKNCTSPTGQARLIPPVPWVLAHLGERGIQVTFGWDWKHPQVLRPDREAEI